LRNYAFPGVFIAIGLGLVAAVAVGVGMFSLVLGVIAFAVCYEKPKASA
jgi:membrane protein implicated in regulation of membrane protease activity